MVTEFSQWLAAMATEDFTLINPMQEGMMDSAVSVLDAESSNLILQGTTKKDILLALNNTPLLFVRDSSNLG